MNKNLFYLLATLLLSLPVQAQTSMETMVNRLKAFGTRIPQEQIFLHLDNTSYYLGDTIFYKAYVSRTDKGTPTDLSGILYCELLNHDGYLVERQMIELDRGEGHGNFALTDTMLYSGYYEVRAYTRWQLNWGTIQRPHNRWATDYFFNKDMARDYYRDYEKLYSRVFPVYDQPRTPGNFLPDMSLRPLSEYHKTDNTRRAHVTFYPEGGALVAELPQRVAWEARDQEGRFLDGTLTVTLPSGDTITSVTHHSGRGLFQITAPYDTHISTTFVPATGRGTTNPVGIPQAQVRLPRPVRNGVSLRMESDSLGLTLSCAAIDTASHETLGLTIMRNGTLQHFSVLDGSQVRFTPTQPGVYQATVFNEHGRVYADRLAFFLPSHISTSTVSFSVPANTVYQPFAPVSMEVSGAPDASLSLSVRDAARSEYIYDTGNMLTEQLLSSHIRGFVPHPQWYFQQDSPQRRLALDLLLMVQGWRRYSWHQMALPGNFAVVHMPESRYPHWTGQVHRYSSSPLLNDFLQADMKLAQSSGQTSTDGASGEDQSHDSFSSDDDSQSSSQDITSQSALPNDPRDRFHKKEAALKYPVALHAEFSQPGNPGVDGDMRSQGTFSMDFPRYYEEFFFFLGASDTTRWKKGQPPIWTQNGKDKNDEMTYPEFYVKLDPIYPRFPHPYDYYQTHVAPLPKDNPLYNAMDEQVRLLSEVTVGARRGGSRNFRYWKPAFRVDAYEAFNATCDAGLAPGCFMGRERFIQDIARTYIGDMGLEQRYDIGELLNGKSVNSQTAMEQRNQKTDIPNAIPESRSFFYSDEKLNRYNYLWNLSDVYVYTDYSPRQVHNNIMKKSVHPKVVVDLHLMPDDGERTYFQNRRWKMKGFSVPDEFYSPDYSTTPLPPADYRRTLYWNPSVKLDHSGRATVSFFNNSSRTLLQIRAEGWTPQGTPQCGEMN